MLRVSISILLVALLLSFAPRLGAQEKSEQDVCDPKDGLLRGPLEFNDLSGSSIECTRVEDRNGVKWRYFHLQASGGTFIYTGKREVLRGAITSLDLRAARTFKGNSTIPIFEISPNGLSLSVTLDHTASEAVFGGTMQIASGTELKFTNGVKIVIRGIGKTGQVGTLRSVAPSIALRRVQLSPSGLPGPLTANFQGSNVLLELSCSTGQLRVKAGTFNGQLADRNPPVPFEFRTATYRSLITSLVVPDVQLQVGSTVLVTFGNLKAAGELVAIVDQEDKLPLLLNGSVQVAESDGRASYSDGPLEISNMRVRDLRFVPAKGVDIAEAIHPTKKQAEFLSELGLTTLTGSQQAAIQEGMAALKSTVPNILINVTSEYLKPFLTANALQIGLKATQLYFGQQEVLALANSGAGPGSDPSNFILRLVPSIVNQELKVRYTVDNMSIEQYRQPSWTLVSQITKDLHDRAKSIYDAASDPNAMQMVKLPMVFTDSFDVNFSTTDPASGITAKVSGDRTSLTSTIVAQAILLDKDGMHLLATVNIQ